MVYPTARGIPRRRIVSADNERVALLFSLEWGHFPVVAVIYLRAEVSTGWTLPHVGVKRQNVCPESLIFML